MSTIILISHDSKIMLKILQARIRSDRVPEELWKEICNTV